MRKIIVEVPDGALLKLETVTLVEASPNPGKRAQTRLYKVLKANKARSQRTIQLKSSASLTAREQRSLALNKVFGIFKGRQDAPQDGLAFQLAIRAE
ncbi:hypothetical protein MJ904_08580 [Massilia sp. MB5]|uniref:hypothetical protein n=1 Tax=Massilia sp. MB5 TaxID=2919578 RepID=UPI001F10CE8B|nr:hypothetical protein [Massilia sp. MB5]UMR32211.1 hypothetical protein MJ904_08580 [Massilia sp. MB5]